MNPIRTDSTNPFAHHTMAVRVPGIIREIQMLNPDYPAPILRALDKLHDSIVRNELIPMLELPAPDYDHWQTALAARPGVTWLCCDWFFAEMFMYRLLIQAVRWWETGRDPFAPKKAEEYRGAAPWRLLQRALNVEGSLAERLTELIGFALWGNRIDLSYAAAAAHGETAHPDDLLTDNRPRVVRHLLSASGTVHIVTDNAGSELLMDLVLVDALINLPDTTVMLHVKMHPTYVSDATVADVLWLINHLVSGSNGGAELGLRLQAAHQTGRLRLAPDFFWNSSYFIGDLPPRLTHLFQNARLVIFKGDANYRRLVGDTIWPPETPLKQVVPFSAPLLALRTLKSDPVVGLPAGLAAHLDGLDAQWRVNGRRGIIQTARA